MHTIGLPDWAHWDVRGEPPWSISVCEDVMIIEPDRGVPARLDSADLRKLSPLLAARVSSEAGAGIVALATTRHRTIAAAGAELALMRSELAAMLDERLGLAAAAAGLHPWFETRHEP